MSDFEQRNKAFARGMADVQVSYIEAERAVCDLEADNRKLRELVRNYHAFADAMCAERDCDGCSLRDEGACERGVLTSRECVLGVET